MKTTHTHIPAPRRLWLAGLVGSLLLGLAPAAWAQASPPSGPVVKLVVGYAAGGPVDMAARVFAPVLGRELGQNVIVENRPGAAGAMGGASVAKASPNGAELFFAASPTLTITPHVMKTMPLDVRKDLAPVAPILTYANVLVVNNDLPVKTVPELIAYARAHPGNLAYGSAGMGASNHLSGELFAQRTQTQMTHVPYRGNAPAMADVMGGQIQMMFDIIGSARGYIDGQKVRPLAVTSRERNPSLPDLPSMAELGVPNYDVGGWFGLYGPQGMAPDLMRRLATATGKALQDGELRKRWAEQGYVVWSGSATDLHKRQVDELALWAEVTKGMKFE